MNRSRFHSKRKTLGLGLVELMIALLISLMILGTLSTLLISGKQINQTQDDLIAMQENARFAFSVIGKAIRQSGYRLDVSLPLATNAIEGSNGKGDGANAKPDVITLRADPVWVPDNKNILQGEEANCAGGIIRSDNLPDPKSGLHALNSQWIVSSFSIDQGELRCATTNQNGKSTSAILVGNVENMQITYGIATDSSNEITAYETADRVQNFSHVASVRVELLMKGVNKDSSTQAQTLRFNGGTLAPDDGFLRQVYASTFALRNRPE